jgi:hypothetical protein
MPANEWLIRRNKHIKQAYNFFKEAEKIFAEFKKNNKKNKQEIKTND